MSTSRMTEEHRGKYGTEGVLKKHVDFFDRNHDGVIYPWETWEGFRAVGYNLFLSFWGTFLVHAFMAIPSWDSLWPNTEKLFLPVYVKNIRFCKHGSDSEVYDTDGEYHVLGGLNVLRSMKLQRSGVGKFVHEKFDQLFEKHAKTYAKGDPNVEPFLTLEEVWEMTQANRNVFDFFGWIAEKIEWGFFGLLAADEHGRVTKSQTRKMIDGSLFEEMERERRAGASRSEAAAHAKGE